MFNSFRVVKFSNIPATPAFHTGLFGLNPFRIFLHQIKATPSTMFFLLPEQHTSIVVLANTSGAIEEVFGIGVLFFDIAAQN